MDADGSKRIPHFEILAQGQKDGIVFNYVKKGISSFFGGAHPMFSSSLAIPKNILEITGGFTDKAPYRNDLDMILRIALLFPIAWNKEILAVWYQDAVNRHFNIVRAKSEPAVSRTARLAFGARSTFSSGGRVSAKLPTPAGTTTLFR